MEDQEYEAPINAHLRKRALEQAIVYCSVRSNVSLDDVVKVAATFYEFLKGETK